MLIGPHSSFLSFVSDVKSFDDRLQTYIATAYAQKQSVSPALVAPHKQFAFRVDTNWQLDIRTF